MRVIHFSDKTLLSGVFVYRNSLGFIGLLLTKTHFYGIVPGYIKRLFSREFRKHPVFLVFVEGTFPPHHCTVKPVLGVTMGHNKQEDRFAYLADRAMGRGGAWAKRDDVGFDASTLPPRVTAYRRADIPSCPAPTATRSKESAIPTGARSPTTICRKAAAEPVAQKVVVKPPFAAVEIAPDTTAELAAVRTRLLSVLRARQAVLEREEAARQAAEAERMRIEAEAERVRRDAEAAQLRKEQERLVREQAVLSDERSRLIEAFRVVDMAVFALLWPDKSFTREYIISWVRGLDIAGVRSTQRHLTDKTAIHTAAKARAESARREAEARAAALNPKKKGFDLLAHLKAKVADPVAPVRPPPSKEELAELDREVNGVREREVVIVYTEDPKRSLRERIEALDPMTVSRLHSGRPAVYREVWQCRMKVLERVSHTWPTVERLLNALRGAKVKNEGRVSADLEMIGRIQTFVAWCEQS